MPKLLALLTLLALVSVCACAGNASRLGAREVSLRASIEDATDAMAQSAKANDMHAVAKRYADDAVMLGPDGMRLAGHDAIDQYWMSLAGDVLDWKLDTFAVHGARDVAHQTGRSRLYLRDQNGATQLSEVLFSVIWRQQPSGEWKIVVDAFWPPDSKS